MTYEAKSDQLVYLPELHSFENWTSARVMESMLLKVTETLWTGLEQELYEPNLRTYLRHCVRNAYLLYGYVRLLRQWKQVDELALVLSPD